MSKTLFGIAACIVAFLALSTHAVAQTLWVVDDSGGAGVHYTDIPTIASPIASGDGIYIKHGTYSNDLDVDGFSLTVFAAPGATVTLTGNVTVQNLDSDQWVVLEGLRSASGSNAVNEVKNNLGSVWIEECALEGSASGLSITNSSEVVLTRSTFVGDDGISVDSSAVAIYGSTATARDQTGTGVAGGDGLTIGSTGNVFAAGSSFAGGNGGPGGPGCSPGGPGGNGATVHASAVFEHWDLAFSGGHGGAYQPGCPGMPVDGKLEEGPGTAHAYSSLWVEDSGPTEFGVQMTFDVLGVQGTGFDTFAWHTPCFGFASPPVYGRILPCEPGEGPDDTAPHSYTYSQPSFTGIEVGVAFVQPAYYEPGAFLLGGPTAAIFHRQVP